MEYFKTHHKGLYKQVDFPEFGVVGGVPAQKLLNRFEPYFNNFQTSNRFLRPLKSFRT